MSSFFILSKHWKYFVEIYNNGGDISKKSPESDVGVMSESSDSGGGDDVGIMSDSSEDSGSNTDTSKPPVDDLFSDIFQATIFNTGSPTINKGWHSKDDLKLFKFGEMKVSVLIVVY